MAREKKAGAVATVVRAATGGMRARKGRGRLDGKVALITGAAGNIGETLCRRYLEEGATIIMSGRNRQKLEDAKARLVKQTRARTARLLIVPFDASDAGQVRGGIAEAIAQAGRIDVLVNNAGSAGPKQKLEDVPITPDELELLRAQGSTDTETAIAAAGNLLGLSWNVVRAALPHLRPGASVINISTIFSRTQYYGRTAYVVPKAALNAFSRQLAGQLGGRGIRVNTVFPGPIESERIRNVFAAMDKLRHAKDGTTAGEFFDLMALARSKDGQAPERTFPTVEDVAHTVVFLGSEESAAISGHNFEVTHGMAVRQESRSTWVSRPELRTVDGTGLAVLVAAGDQVADALTIARVQAGCGAQVVLGMGSEESVRAAREALEENDRDRRIRPVLFDRDRPDTLSVALEGWPSEGATLRGAIILPAFGAWRFREPLAEARDGDVAAFLRTELCGAIAIARELTRFWKAHGDSGHRLHVVFMSNGDDGQGNHYADMLRAAMEELCRVWRDETEVQVKAGERRAVEWSNQIVRWTNTEDEGLPFAAGQAARLLFTHRKINQVNLYLPPSLVDATGSRKALFGWMENLHGLHLGKVALITGGSAGIGGQLGRLLALGGARVVLAARRQDELDKMRDAIVQELEDVGYDHASQRVRTLAGVDVADEAALKRCVQETLATFGAIDYLVNNAGIAGAEQMVVDMDPAQWRRTLDANLVSNYSLIEKVVPLMKQRGSGYILNVSSYFGGEKYIAVPYPNRADYAVSKAGQRALTENLARFVGPEIQINAIAPGPVAGDRLRGTGGKPGLFERRGRLILENKRLNQLHAAVVRSLKEGATVEGILALMAGNEMHRLTLDDAPEALRQFAGRAQHEAAQASDEPTCGRFIMDGRIAEKLLARLRNAGLRLDDGSSAADDAAWVAALPAPVEPFLSGAEISGEAAKISKGVLGMLHLRNMPTETEVALATVYFMADRAVSGETFQPSGGLHQERTITERELFGRAKPERIVKMQGQTVWLVGEHLHDHLVRAVELYLDPCRVGRIVLLTRTAAAGEAIMQRIAAIPGAADVVRLQVTGDDIEGGMDAALQAHGRPSAVLSTPYTPIPKALFGIAGADHLDAAGFAELIEGNLTHHFRVARKVSLIEDARLVLASPEVPIGATPAQFAMANFVKTTLHALTATLGVENERLVFHVPVNQVNLTRRVRSEEPRDAGEQAEEIDRFARAVLLASAPLPDTEDSRYRARIYRGLAITV